MQALEPLSCPGCAVRLVDAGDELVCPACGAVDEKLVFEAGPGAVCPSPRRRQPLGSFMGALETTEKERSSRGISGSGSKYDYLKTVSDAAAKETGSAYECDRLVERVGEKLHLPGGVVFEASDIARRVLAAAPPHRRVTVAAVSAYSLIVACRIEGVVSVSAREVLCAHSDQGRPVTSSAIMRLSIDSPVRARSRGATEYIPMVLARLSMVERLARRLRDDGVPTAAYINSLRKTAIELMLLVNETETAGKRPCALAAAAVYSAELVLSSVERRRRRMTQRDTAQCGDASEYTVREQCADIFTPAVEELAARMRLSPHPAFAV